MNGLFTSTTHTVNSNSRDNLKFDYVEDSINYNVLRRSNNANKEESEQSGAPQDHPLLSNYFIANESQMILNEQLLLKNLKHQNRI